ncbi:MAG: sel1 repeat family protein [Nitrospira sp.]|nr:sel1 repeat family protein [Nitrospira sp.]
MGPLVLAGILILSNVATAAALEPLTKDPKPVVPQRSIPLAGEEPYEALKRGDYRAAAGLFHPRAEKGDVRAQYNLGLLYASGMGVMQDYQAALKWHRLAAGQGHAGAQNELAQMYDKGQGVPQDQVRAYVWYSVAGESSTGGSKTEIMKDRDHMAKRMTPEQIHKAEGLTKQCLESEFKKCGEK